MVKLLKEYTYIAFLKNSFELPTLPAEGTGYVFKNLNILKFQLQQYNLK